jgi:hypothetical protein
MLCVAFLLTASAGLAGCSDAISSCAPGANGCTSVLFLGNSYTYVNDLPAAFARLANAGGHDVDVAMVANGGETLAEHAASSDTLGKIASQSWTFVILQEQSQTPATSGGRQQMRAAAATLGAKAFAVGARTLMFVTPAHRDGMPEAGLRTYADMQRAIDDGYVDVARPLGQGLVPAGYVWFVVRQQHPEIGLWQDDGSHPSTAGTYLEACVFYDSIFRQPSAGLAFDDGLPADEARTLRTAADDNVLPSLHEWGLDQPTAR